MKFAVKSRNYTQVLTIVFLTLMSVAVLSAENQGAIDRTENNPPQRAVLPENGVNNLRARQPRITRGQALNIASGEYEGRVLSIRMDNNSWRVRMDRDGTVFNVFVNSASGAVSAASD